VAVSNFAVVLDYPWWLAVFFFGTAAAAIVYLPPKLLGTTWRRAGTAAFVALTLWAGAYFYTFNARLDERGATVNNATAIFQTSGSMRWEDVALIRLVIGFGAFSPTDLRLVSRAGETIDIPLAELPASQIRKLARFVAVHARRAEFEPTEEEFVSEADRIAAQAWRLFGLIRVRS
jgi:hypothetical protein